MPLFSGHTFVKDLYYFPLGPSTRLMSHLEKHHQHRHVVSLFNMVRAVLQTYYHQSSRFSIFAIKYSMSTSKISLDQLRHIAKLARLEIKPEQENYLAQQLSETTAYIDVLGELDTKNVEPTYQTNHLKNITRDDVIGESLTQSDALSQTKDAYNGYFKTQATISKK